MVEPESEPYWAALRDGRLLLKLCASCGKHHFYPRPFCPHCWSDDVRWVEAGGGATLYTHSIVFRERPPAVRSRRCRTSPPWSTSTRARG